MSDLEPPPDKDLEQQVQFVLDHAVDAHCKNLKVYESLRNLNEVIGTEYGDRVLYELIQNAHDAHRPDDEGRIAIRLVIQSETEGVLYIANGGNSFRPEDVEAIKNLATTGKEIGAGIGNKGLGFRSVEALTDDVRIFSRSGEGETERFDGYCLRFAQEEEIKDLLLAKGADPATAGNVAKAIPRYLVPRPLYEQPDDVISYARRGYATVIVIPMRTAEAVDLAERQVRTLADLDVPLLLFLDRIAKFRIDIEASDGLTYQRRLHRRQTVMGDVPNLAGCQMHEVRVGDDRRFLVVRHKVDKERVLDAVKRSISKAPQIKRWLDWKGQPVVSVAVGLSAREVTKGRFYNFLPMGDGAVSPLTGYLDAPFFADIDRRNADFDLPLNDTLMKAAAEACTATALFIVKHNKDVPQRAVFDLVAWAGEHEEKLDDVLTESGSSLRDAPVIPTIAVEGRKSWGSLSEVSIWPEGTFSLLKAREVAKRVGAQLVSTELADCRLDRLRKVALRAYLSLPPSSERLAIWSERFARSLLDRQAAPRTWSHFYEDLNRLFGATGEEGLNALSGKLVLRGRSKKLHRAGGHNGTPEARVFVRSEASKGKRAKDGVPLPPSTLARRYRFLDEKITFRQETLNAFIKANLVREYDPVEALAGLKSALGNKANENQHREALQWAFKVWRTVVGSGVEEALRNAELHVPTRKGWRLATQAAFSSSWTSVGRKLENFLVEAAEVSPDCQRAWDLLLVGFDGWPTSTGDTKHQWIDFLTLLGVADGLRPVAANVQNNESGQRWNTLLRVGDVKEGLDGDWCAETSLNSFEHPYTEYHRKGEAWRLPGQTEHKKLPDTAKEAFSELVFKHLETQGPKFLTFEVGRFERYYERERGRKKLPTPFATFLRSKAWIAINTKEGAGFCKTNQCWAARTRQGRPPRFMDRVPDTVTELVESNQELADLVFGKDLQLRDWQSKDTVVERLGELASASVALASHDRPTFRGEYRRAWLDVVESGVSLPAGLILAVDRSGRLETLSGDAATRPEVTVTQNAQQFEARVLSSAGHALLDVGDASTQKVSDLLTATGMFTPRQLDGIGVRLLVDGDPFVPRADDPLLTSLKLNWLPEVAVLGHELLGEQLERGVLRATVDRRIRAIRVRHCKEITLIVDGERVSSNEMTLYAFEDTELPTLILSDSLRLDWTTMGRELSRAISRLIDTRLRFLEPLLLRLALGQTDDALGAPSDEALCSALQCDATTLQDHRAALRTDLEHILHLLVPVVAYFKNVAFAQEFQNDADRAGSTFDVLHWLRSQFAIAEVAPENLIAACEQAPDRTALRRELDLDYERFNCTLLKLGEPPLSNEAELRQHYDAYLCQMRSVIIERLRRRYAADFRNGLDLAAYVERKTLAFLPFAPEWVLTRETLGMETVEAHVLRLLDEILGEDQAVDLPTLNPLLEKNRRAIREFAACATPVVGTWCRSNQVSIPEPWRNEDPQSVTRHLENAGLLDFELISDEQIPGLCRRVACWPDGMPKTLDSSALGLDQNEVDKEKKHRERERRQKEIELRSIEFAGHSLDTEAPSFAGVLQQLLDDNITEDAAWFERCRLQTRLIKFDTVDQSGTRGKGSGHDGRRRNRQPTDAQRQAVGLAGEYRAFQFLRRRHSEFVDETCWISENRARFFGGREGDDTAGYDFRVKTPQAEWFYEVKSSQEDTGEFELTANELRVAVSAAKEGRRRYRILYVPFVFSPDQWFVLELPNPMGETTRDRFKEVGRGSVRFRFERY